MTQARDLGNVGDSLAGVSNVNIDSGTLFVDTANNRVGVGTTTPGPGGTAAFHVVGYQTIETSGGPYLNLYHPSASSNLKYMRLGQNAGNFVVESINDAYTSPTERFRIDSAGRITKPGQPMCWLGHPATTTYTVNSVVQWSSTYDPLNMFSGASNYRVTVPIAGRYLVMADLLLNSTSAGGSLSVNLRKNGSNIRRLYSQTGYGYQSGSLTAIVNCAASDYLDFQNTEAATIYGGDIGNFVVVLIG